MNSLKFENVFQNSSTSNWRENGKEILEFEQCWYKEHQEDPNFCTNPHKCGRELVCNGGDPGHVGSIPGLGRSPGAGHGDSRVLAWRIPWTEEPGGPQSIVEESDTTEGTWHA